MASRARASYWASVHAIQDRTGASTATARAAWRGFRDHIGHAPSGRETARHPRLIERFTKGAEQTIERARKADEQDRDVREKLKAYATLDEWEQAFPFDDDPIVEIDGAIET